MIQYRSTQSRQAGGVSFQEALFRGQAPDGGLYVPDALPQIDPGRLRAGGFVERASGALGAWLDAELGADVTSTLCREAFDFPVPVSRLNDDTWLLELFHGPTSAFKDFGARFMARAMARLGEPGRRLTVLVATSGDTGSAVAHAFGGLADTQVVLLYPANKVSPLQEAQLTSVPANVHSVRVAGAFDDCQAMVKAAFRDANRAGELGLTSANSINVGRLLPQLTYYVHAGLELEEAGAPLVVVPSGNLGNLTAGLLARLSGAPIAGFLAAANRNDVFPRYLESGVLEARQAVRTPSNAMDVGNPSNAARIVALYAGHFESLRRDVTGESVSDDETLATIRQTWEATGRFVCPHTAVGLAARRRRGDPRPAVVLATAHPGKFAEIVREATGEEIALPETLARALTSRRTPLDIPPDPLALLELLRTLA
ncbi:MAG: threonine synthase [Candidatus Krumholzibacteriia bacterium]